MGHLYCTYTMLSNTRSSRPCYILSIIFIFVLVVFLSIVFVMITRKNTNSLYPLSLIQLSRSQEQSISYTKRYFNDCTTPVEKHRESSDVHTFKLVCYYNFPQKTGLQPAQLDPFLCTHLIVAFAKIQDNCLYLELNQLEVVNSVVALKQVNPQLNVLISVGGAGNDQGFPQMVLNHTNRKTFIRSVIKFVRRYHIDGIDLDWEFPNRDISKDKHQRTHFTQLLEEFRVAINRHRNVKFLVTVATAAPDVLIDLSYDVTYLNQYVDFINVMSYDYHFYTKWTPFTGLNSPLYQTEHDIATLNINHTANYWLYKGMERGKIVLGLPTYGHTFTLTNINNNGLYAPAMGYGHLGSGGFIDYTQTCQFLTDNKISPVFDKQAKSPYAFKLTEWISFENEQSIAFKAEFVKKNQFAGAMIYSLNADDYNGNCRTNPNAPPRPFPLVTSVSDIFNRNFSLI